MSLSPLAIALQGIGFASQLVAAHGLLPVEQAAGGGGRRPNISFNFSLNDDQEVLDLVVIAMIAADAAVH
jgi:hypothetical protein